MGSLVRLPGSLPQSHGIPAEVAMEEAWIEAQAIAGEAERFARDVAAVARLIGLAIVAGRPAIAEAHAKALAGAAGRAQARARVARIAAAIAAERCPDDVLGPGHGKAA